MIAGFTFQTGPEEQPSGWRWEMRHFNDPVTYRHENRTFRLLRMIAPAIVVALFLVAFVSSLIWQSS